MISQMQRYVQNLGIDVGFIFRLFGKVCPRGPQTRQNHENSMMFRRFPVFFSKIFCQVLQIRRLCRYAGFADMHVLQIRRFCLSRVPAFVPASASAVIADADCIGVRRWPAVGVFNMTLYVCLMCFHMFFVIWLDGGSAGGRVGGAFTSYYTQKTC